MNIEQFYRQGLPLDIGILMVMKLVIFNGAACSGKSTIIENLMKQKGRYFYISYDSLKWHFSQYESGKYREDIFSLRLSMLRALCELKYNVLTEAGRQTSRQKHIEIAVSYGYEIVEINLEADYEILLKRLEERIASGRIKGNHSRERFDEVYNTFRSEKKPSAITFRTDVKSIDDITEAILKLL